MTEKELVRLTRKNRKKSPYGGRKRSRGISSESPASRPEDIQSDENLTRNVDAEPIDVTAQKSQGNDRAARMASAGASGSSGTDTLANIGIASGNPYAMGAGAGLKVLGAAEKRKQQDRDKRYRAKLARISRQQNALNNLMQMSQGLNL